MAEEQTQSGPVFDAADEYRPEPPPPPEIPAWKDGSRRIGIHTSIAGGFAGALDIAQGLGANAIQIFSASPRMWGGGARIPEGEASGFRSRRRELGLGPVVIHANYLINLASPNPVLRARSIQAFHHEIVRAIVLGADYLVLHPGSRQDASAESAIVSIARGLQQAARGLKLGELRILLENTAGQGSSVGSRFEELKSIADACAVLPLGVCVDTAHLFAAGWDLRTPEGLDAALRHMTATIGLERVAVVHVNDSKAPLGARVDRHEHLGKGKIGMEGLRRIVNHPSLAGRTWILETPIDKPGDDLRNVAALWKLAGEPSAAATGRRSLSGRKKKTAPRAPRKRKAAAKKIRRRHSPHAGRRPGG